MCIDVFLIYLNDLENIHEMNEESLKDKMISFLTRWVDPF